MSERKKITLTTLGKMKQAGEKIAVLTAYDSTFTVVEEMAGVDAIIVGDSLGMVIQGKESTVPVSLSDMIYHTANVARVRQHAFIVADMPFMSYASSAEALGNAARLMQEGGAHMVKIEGGSFRLEVVCEMVGNGIPVCAHLGLTPQSVHAQGGYRVQGRDEASAHTILDDAEALQDAGAGMLVLECVPSVLGSEISHALKIPVIGIGAGPDCDGQVLVLHDMLGITPGKRPVFSRDFMQGQDSIQGAIEAYVRDVKSGAYPAPEHCYN